MYRYKPFAKLHFCLMLVLTRDWISAFLSYVERNTVCYLRHGQKLLVNRWRATGLKHNTTTTKKMNPLLNTQREVKKRDLSKPSVAKRSTLR